MMDYLFDLLMFHFYLTNAGQQGRFIRLYFVVFSDSNI